MLLFALLNPAMAFEKQVFVTALVTWTLGPEGGLGLSGDISPRWALGEANGVNPEAGPYLMVGVSLTDARFERAALGVVGAMAEHHIADRGYNADWQLEARTGLGVEKSGPGLHGAVGVAALPGGGLGIAAQAETIFDWGPSWATVGLGPRTHVLASTYLL